MEKVIKYTLFPTYCMIMLLIYFCERQHLESMCYTMFCMSVFVIFIFIDHYTDKIIAEIRKTQPKVKEEKEYEHLST